MLNDLQASATTTSLSQSRLQPTCSPSSKLSLTRPLSFSTPATHTPERRGIWQRYIRTFTSISARSFLWSQRMASARSSSRCWNSLQRTNYCGRVGSHQKTYIFALIVHFLADGHWWPESYYLASIQSRQALYEVMPNQRVSLWLKSDITT